MIAIVAQAHTFPYIMVAYAKAPPVMTTSLANLHMTAVDCYGMKETL
jgi:hypothetical protein